MNIRKELAKIIAGKQPDPLTKVAGGGTDEQKFPRIGWEDKTDPRAKIKKWMDRYNRGGPYADAVDAYPLFALSAGWNLVCEEGYDGLKDRVQDWLDQPQNDLDAVMWQGILSAILAGDSYQELIPTKKGIPWGIVTRDPSTFRKEYDAYGRITGYRQYVKDTTYGSDTGISIPQDRIINLVLFRAPGSVYGLSLWERADDDIQRDCDIIESVTKAIHRHGTPKQQWDIGSPENPATDVDFDRVEDEIQKIGPKTDFVTSNTKIHMLDTSGVSNVDTYSNTSLQRVACALGVPEEMLGLGRGSTEATATVRMRAFMDKVTTIQTVVARTYTRNLIDQITGQPGKVWIEFNDVNPEDEAKVAEWIAKLRTGIDQDAICYASWAQERLGIPPNPEEEIEEKEQPTTDTRQTQLPGTEGEPTTEPQGSLT